MNKLLSGFLITVSMLFLNTSCKKVLDVGPYNSLTDVTTFTSPERIEGAVNGVYDAAQSGFYAGGAVRGYPFGAASIEQGDMRGEDMLTYVTFYHFTYEASYNTTTANNDYMFQTLYSLINKANLTIEGVTGAVSQGIISSTLGNEYIAECRFLRAMAHHELLIHFSRPYRDGNGDKLGIIYRDFGINSDATSALAKSKTRTSVADGYNKILADLDFAENNLPVSTSTAPAPVNAAANKTYRTTKAAAIALKMRIRLHMGDWANVIVEGNKIVPATPVLTSYPGFISQIGGWKLETTPAIPFTTAGWQGNETVFSMRNASTDNGGVNGALANMHANTSIGGRAIIRISPIVYNLPAFRCDDLRRNMMGLVGSGAAANYLTTKYIDATTSTDPAPLIRYSEVLLTLAEAEARQNGITVKALQLLNEVRNRALPGGPGTFTVPPVNTYTAASFANTNEFIKAILDERRIEFIAEGKRWGDIHRNATDANFTTGGIPAKIGIGVSTFAMYSCGAGNATYTTAIAAFPYTDYRFLWPIPLSETQTNTNYAQNPGW
ncbi:MAG TPA: RagB/SusD family nutrient uptake outer membrane protein [Chitinophagaceae bacterium]|nr:RagB/SusD family nutrient uptake outer membrane protein [Chitinophagaceae bacterium]